MAVYKVPQDVEAEDKLLGPFSFRQFIYLCIAAGSIAVGFFLFRVFPGLVIIPLPVVILFGALALPLRRDQPMETYLLAIIRFYLKPKRRIWNPDGTMTYVVITAPQTEEAPLRSLGQESTQQRLDYLARVMDSRGWAVKGVEKANDNLSQMVVAESADLSDIMDEHADLARSFDDLIAKKKQEYLQNAKISMQKASQAPAATPTPPLAKNPYEDVLTQQFTPQNSTPAEPATAPHFNPYPSAMHQKVILPVGSQPAPRRATPAVSRPAPAPKPAANAVTHTVSPGIMRLANNPDLNISTIAREARRLQEGDEGEVIISLH